MDQPDKPVPEQPTAQAPIVPTVVASMGIYLLSDGSLQLGGGTENKLLALGMLELAKAIVLSQSRA